MSLLPQDVEMLRAFGYNPDEYEYVPETPPTPPEQKVSIPRAYYLSLRKNAAPATAALAVGSKVGAASAPYFASFAPVPVVGPAIAIGGPLLTGFGAGVLSYLGTGGLQEGLTRALESDEATQQRLAEEAAAQEQHPVASFLGANTPSMAYLAPSIANLGRTFTSLGRAVNASVTPGGSIRLSAPDRALLMNQAVNVAQGAGGQVVSDVLAGRDINLPELAGNIALNVLQTRPTTLGRYIGLQDITPSRIPVFTKPQTETVSPGTTAEPKQQTILRQRYIEQERLKELAAKQKEEQKFVHGKIQPGSEEYPTQAYQTEPVRSKVMPNSLETLKYRYQETKKPKYKRLVIEPTGEKPNTVIPKEEPELPLNPQPAQTKQQKPTKPPTPPVPEPVAIKPPQPTKQVPVPENVQKFAQEEGVKFYSKPDIYAENPQTGKVSPASGYLETMPKYDPVEKRYIRQATINPDAVQPDTFIHEAAHARFADMIGTPQEVPYLRSILRSMGFDADISRLSPNDPRIVTYEEKLVDAVGKNWDAPISWWQDFKTSLKLALGREISPQDAAKHFIETIRKGPTRTERILQYGKLPPKSSTAPGDIRYQKYGLPELDEMEVGTSEVLRREPFAYRLINRINPFRITEPVLDSVAKIDKDFGWRAARAANEVMVSTRKFIGEFGEIFDATKGLTKAEKDFLLRLFYAESRNRTQLRDKIQNVEGINHENVLAAYDKIRAGLDKIVDTQNAHGELVTEYRAKRISVDKEGRPLKEYPAGVQLPREPENPNHDRYIYRKEKPIKRERIKRPYYFPQQPSERVKEILMNPNSEAAILLLSDLRQHLENNGYPFDLVQEIISEYSSQRGGKLKPFKFGPSRKMEGVGLPDSWLETDIDIALQRFVRNTARDLAGFIHIENAIDEDGVPIGRLFGIKYDQQNKPLPDRATMPDGTHRKVPDLSGSRPMQHILEAISGNLYQKHPTIDAFVSLANTMLLGPVSGISDVASVPIQAMKFMEGSGHFGLLKAGLTDWKKAIQGAIKYGVASRQKQAHIEDMVNVVDRASTALLKLRDLVYKGQGREHLEIIARAYAFLSGQFIADWHHTRLLTLPQKSPEYKRSLVFFQKLYRDPNFERTKLVDPDFDLDDAAARIAELMQGTYDFRNLPAWAIDSGIAPFFRLARWGIEQTNNFKRYVIDPAIEQKNFRPLVYALLGSTLGGAVLKELREKLNLRESYTPDLIEIASSSRGLSGNVPLVLHNIIINASYAGFAGILSDMIRSIMDYGYGNRVQSFEFPAHGLISSVVGDSIQALTALMNGETDLLTVAPQLVGNQLKSHIQLARLINAHVFEHPKYGISPEKVHQRKTQEAFRNLRAYRMTEGLPYTSASDISTNEYSYPERRDFKRTPSLKRAKELLPKVRTGILEQSKGNPELRERLFTGMKISPYPVLPAGEREKRRYYQWLVAAHGKQRADEIFRTAHLMREINKKKSGMIQAQQR